MTVSPEKLNACYKTCAPPGGRDQRLAKGVTHMDSFDKGTVALAEAFGIEPEYTDAWGKVHPTDPRTARKILQAKGVRIDDESIPSATSGLIVSKGELPDTLPLSVDAPQESEYSPPAVQRVVVHIADEPAKARVFSYEPSQISALGRDHTGAMRLAVPFPSPLPEGVYRVRVEVHFGKHSRNVETRWSICPAQAYLPPELHDERTIAGVACALYGVRSSTNWGIGDFADLTRIIDWAADDLGVDLVGLNPLHALFNRAPYNISPYMPSSRFFRNPIYLDVPGMAHFQESVPAKILVERPETSALIERLRHAETVQYEEVAKLKLQILHEVFRTFLETHRAPESRGDQWAEFVSYIETEGDYLDRYATFCALDALFRAQDPPLFTWKEWPVDYRAPDTPTVKAFQSENRDEILFWKYLQWQLEKQLERSQAYARQKGMLVGLYHDQALAVDRSGADSWAMQRFFLEGFTVGAPPDPFAPNGQDWGFAPPNSRQLQSAEYEPFIRLLRANCRHGGALRIDHVMQFNRLFWIPQGKTPAKGVYVKDFEEELINLLAQESHRNKTLVIGEDLGTVPMDFRERLMRKGILSYRLYYFERDRHGNPLPHTAYPRNALVSITTHDLPTLAGFWSAADIELRRTVGHLDDDKEKSAREERTDHKAKIIKTLVDYGFLPAHTAHEAWISPFPTEHLQSAIIAFLLSTPSRLVVINQEDLFLDTRQQNLPGTTWENPNWVTKMRYSVEELQANPEATRFNQRFRDLVTTRDRSIRNR